MEKITKESLIKTCAMLLEAKVDTAKLAMNLAEEALFSDTKSSAGDKFETGREMAQQEISRSKRLLMEIEQQLFSLKKLEGFLEPAPSAQAGSLVYTNHGVFYLGISLGLVQHQGQGIMVISTQAPIAKVMLGKTKAESFEFMQKSYTIVEIL